MARPQYYTTQLQAGAGLVEETRLLLSLYEPGMEPQALLARALDSGLFPRVTARRLRNVVIECFAPRYMREPDAAWMLKQLTEHVSRAEAPRVFGNPHQIGGEIIAVAFSDPDEPAVGCRRDKLIALIGVNI